ncbi:MAG: hypothetical protein ACYSO3_00105 [Planctomycetota bacterium]|jgi:hypothetical protein
MIDIKVYNREGKELEDLQVDAQAGNRHVSCQQAGWNGCHEESRNG